MTGYTWICFSCQRPNPAGREECVHCGAAACQSGRQIAEAQGVRSHDAKVQANQSSPPPSPSPGTGEVGLFSGLAMLAFCVVCIYGGLVAMWGGHWPAFMPPQLDGLAALLSFASPELAAVIVGLLAVLLGVGGLAAVLLAGNKRNDA